MAKRRCQYGKVKGSNRCKTKTQFVKAMQKGRRKAKKTYLPPMPKMPKMPSTSSMTDFASGFNSDEDF